MLRLYYDGSAPGGVCSAFRLAGFGEKQAGGYDKEASYSDYGYCAHNYADFEKRLKEAALKVNKVYPLNKAALIYAFATTMQPQAQHWLRQYGFTEFAVPTFLKYNHGLSLFSISMEDFCAKVGIVYEDDDRHGGYLTEGTLGPMFSGDEPEIYTLREEEPIPLPEIDVEIEDD